MNIAMHIPAHVSDRAITIGIAVSVVLHLVVLFAFAPARPGPASSPGDMVLQARLMPRSAIRERAPPPEPEQQKPEPPRPEPPRRVETPPLPVPRPPVPTMATPAPSTAPRVAAAPPTPPAAPSAPATPPAAAPQPVQPPPAAAPPATGGSPGSQEIASVDASRSQQSSVDAGSVSRFLQDILMGARRYKRYPAQAMDKGWQGKVEIRLVMGSNGSPLSYSIKTSSGYQLLDDTALDMVKKGRPWARVPPALVGREFTVDVPVVFDLREG